MTSQNSTADTGRPTIDEAAHKTTHKTTRGRRQSRGGSPSGKTCGKCGSRIAQPGPCPTCDDSPFGGGR